MKQNSDDHKRHGIAHIDGTPSPGTSAPNVEQKGIGRCLSVERTLAELAALLANTQLDPVLFGADSATLARWVGDLQIARRVVKNTRDLLAGD